MYMQSGRIRQVGIQPNRGMSLGFVGMGQTCPGEVDDAGKCCSGQVDNGTCIGITSDPVMVAPDNSVPFGSGPGYTVDSGSATQTVTSYNSSQSNALQNAINAMTAVQYAAFQALTPAQQSAYVAAHPETSSSSSYTTYIVLGVMAFGLLLAMKK